MLGEFDGLTEFSKDARDGAVMTLGHTLKPVIKCLDSNPH